jgi:hypothetical protein
MAVKDQIWQPGNAILPPPIFVLGARPTNTALVGAMIGRNAGAFGLPELNLFVVDTLEEMATAMPDPSQHHGLLRALAYIYGSEQTIVSIAMARRWLLRRLSWTTNRVFDELRNQVTPRRLVDKSASYSQNARTLKYIGETLPGAYYVHVIEHPLAVRAVPVSLERKRAVSGEHQGVVAEMSTVDQMQWLNIQRLISEAMNHVTPERRTVLRMENLLSDPRTELDDLCRKLDLSTDETAVADMLHPEHSPFAGLGPVGANLGDDLAFLRDPSFPPKSISDALDLPRGSEHMLAQVAQFAARYGYD